MKLERRGDARKADVTLGWVDAEPGLPPQRVLGLFHVPEEGAEMNDAGGVGFVEMDTASEPIFTEHGKTEGYDYV